MASFDIVIQVTYVYRPSAGEKVLGTKQILLASITSRAIVVNKGTI